MSNSIPTLFSSLNTEKCIPIGIDIGSRNARVAISSDLHHTSSSESNNTSSHQPFSFIPPTLTTILTNELGTRETLALSTVEPETVHDSFNDEYYAHNYSTTNNNNNSSNTKQEVKKPGYIFGEAARRSLQREKKSLQTYFIHSMISKDCEEQEYDDLENEIDNHDTNTNDNTNAITAFFQYLTTQTTNTTHTHPSTLRIVLSTPMHNSNNKIDSNYHSKLQQKLIFNAHNGILQSIQQVGGWETSPHFLNNQDSIKTKRDKKQLIQQLESLSSFSDSSNENNLQKSSFVLDVITEPMAICYAHGLFQSIVEHDTDDLIQGNNMPTSPSSSSPPLNWKKILVIDWGASALKLTSLQRIGHTQIASCLKHCIYTNYSGNVILSRLISHVAEQFERKHRIPMGDVLDNKRSRAQLEIACEEAFKTLSRGLVPKVQITIDGLYDGLDCNVEVMLARFEMLCGDIVRNVHSCLLDIMNNNNCDGDNWDVVLTAGNVVRMSFASTLIQKIFSSTTNTTTWMGKSYTDVPPEEAVAMGCAMYASTLLSPFGRRVEALLSSSRNEISNDSSSSSTTSIHQQANKNIGSFDTEYKVEREVLVCPTSIGLSFHEDNDESPILLIEKGSPLPVFITRKIDISQDSSSAKEEKDILRLIQILNDDSNNSNEEKNLVFATIDGINDNNNNSGVSDKFLEVTMYLSTKGKLSIALNGGEVISL